MVGGESACKLKYTVNVDHISSFYVSTTDANVLQVYRFHRLSFILLFADLTTLLGQDEAEKPSRQATLRGSITPERQWWDLKHYHLSVSLDPKTKSLSGSNAVSFTAIEAGDKLQIDLQEPLEIKKVTHEKQELKFQREGNVYWVDFPREISKGSTHKIVIEYGGTPIESKKSSMEWWCVVEERRQRQRFYCDGLPRNRSKYLVAVQRPRVR